MDITIGRTVIDEDGAVCEVTNVTTNSIEVFIEKKTDKGINARNWFTEKKFYDRFKV